MKKKTEKLILPSCLRRICEDFEQLVRNFAKGVCRLTNSLRVLLKVNLGRIATMLIVVFSMSTTTLAAGLDDGASGMRSLLEWIAVWVTWLGVALAFFGAIQIAFGFRSEDAEAKAKGLKAMVAGFVVLGVGSVGQVFGAQIQAVNIGTHSDMTGEGATALSGITNFLATIATTLGVFVTFWGAVQMAMATRSDDANSKAKGLQILIAGVILMGMPALVSGFIFG